MPRTPRRWLALTIRVVGWTLLGALLLAIVWLDLETL